MDTPAPKKRFSSKGFTSLLLTCAFLVLTVTGGILYVTPRGRDAHWTNWSLFGLDKEQWGALHINISVLFLIVAAVHLTLNWTVFWSYIKKRATGGLHLRRELASALVVGALFVCGTLYGLPPFSTVVDWNSAIKDYWSQQSAQAPVAHSEEFTLAEFAAEIDISAEEAMESLRQQGFDVEDPAGKMKEIAATRGVAPSDVFAAIQKHHPQAGHLQGRGRGMGGGRGMGAGRGQGFEGGCESEQAEGDQTASGDAEGIEQGSEGGSDPDEHAGFGQGLGQGRGPGSGMGMGRGMGMGMGMGRGQGRGMAAEGESDAPCEHDAEEASADSEEAEE